MIRKLFKPQHFNRFFFADNKKPPQNEPKNIKKKSQAIQNDQNKAEILKADQVASQKNESQQFETIILKESKEIKEVQQKKRILDHKFMNLASTVELEYKNYPTHLKHNDPNSEDYVHSERDEFKQNTEIDAYNSVIRRLKNDLHMQRQVYEVLEKMDRPYLKGVPGNTKNISIGLQNYSVLEDIGFQRKSDEFDNEYIENSLKNQDRWISNSQFIPKYTKMSNEIAHQKELDERPVNDHFQHDKGSKYDVAVPYEQRYPYLADRLGHPEILGTPYERLMRLESDIFHPVFLDQPFVQIPKADPHSNLNFEEGEVIYENTQLQEWAKLIKLTGASIYGFFALFVPYNLIIKTHFPLQDAYNNVFMNYHIQSYFNYDNFNLHMPVYCGSLMYLSYYFFAASDKIFKDYVVRLQYSKDKELLFVTRVSPYGSTEEEVYEMAHLEVLPPSVKTSIPYLASQQEDGLWDITCMNTQNNLVVKNEDHFWAPGHKKDFLNKVTGLWQDYAQKPQYD